LIDDFLKDFGGLGGLKHGWRSLRIIVMVRPLIRSDQGHVKRQRWCGRI
jgi:hypothetical protein